MKELVVISGKGGTGKTSVVASFAALARRAVVADCDVDAADLHLLLAPRNLRCEDFSGGARAAVDPGRCVACGRCRELCRFDAIGQDGPRNAAGERTYRVDPVACEGCGVCAEFCPAQAITLKPVVNGQWFIAESRYGPMVHAALRPGEENSGKLVSIVRTQARKVAEQDGLDLILVDGSPGIGCPVIASITGADLTLAVAEPSLSGLHDLVRVADLAGHFGIPMLVCINKWDINAELTERIEATAAERDIPLAGRVRYDPAVTAAQIQGRTVVEFTQAGAAEDISRLWQRVASELAHG